jgi:AcrR family transcriptional regulator
MTDPRRPGRPRSETARAAILDAAVAELQEKGFAATTVDAIAARAGVGKQTIYRWWSSKADVVLEGVMRLAAERIPMPDQGSLHADLLSFLGATFRQRGQRPVLVGMMAQAVLDPVFGEKFREQFLFARRAALRSLLERAVVRGEIAPGADLELLIDVVYGVLWYRLLVDHIPLDEAGGRALADLVTRAAT